MNMLTSVMFDSVDMLTWTFYEILCYTYHLKKETYCKLIDVTNIIFKVVDMTHLALFEVA